MAITRMTLDEVRARPSKMNRAKVRATGEKDIAQHMIEDDEDPALPLRAQDIVSPADIRKRMGMSQPEFARMLSIPVATLRNWEQSRVAMDPAVITLMRILANEPKAALRALGRKAA